MLRVAIAYTFDDHNWLGGRNYFCSLFAAVKNFAPGNIEFVLVTGNSTKTTLPDQFPELEVIRTGMFDRRTVKWGVRNMLRLPFAMQRDPMLSTLLRSHRIDVLSHSGGLGKDSPVKSLGWLPDFQFLRFPAYWTPRQLRETKRLYNSTCNSSNAIVLSSHSALSDLKEFSPECSTPAHVLNFVSLPIQLEQLLDLQELERRYSFNGRYFHLPNQFWAHKNHGVVIEALALLKQGGIEVNVLCTGNTSDIRRPDYFDSLVSRCEAAGVSGNFKVLGLVPYKDVQSLMLHATAVINPSSFEGWSTTVEEAKTLNKALILSDIPVHREQAPSAAVYFPQNNAQALADAMKASLLAPVRYASACEIEVGHASRLKAFAERYLSILRSI